MRVLGATAGWPVLDSYLYAETGPIWFRSVAGTDPAAKKPAAEKLLRMLDASEVKLRAGYVNAPTANLLEHFAASSTRLQAIVAGQGRTWSIADLRCRKP